MIIRPVSDLRNKFPEVEAEDLNENAPVFLTKNGYGTMVLMSLDQYSELVDPIAYELKQTDIYARENSKRFSLSEVFDEAEAIINGAEI